MFFPIYDFYFIPQGQVVSFFFPYTVSHNWLFNLSPTYCHSFNLTFAFVYFATTAILGNVVFYRGLDEEEIFFEESHHSWILSWYHMDYIPFGSLRLGLFHKADSLRWVFGYRPLSFNLDFLELMLCSLGSCCNGDSQLTEFKSWWRLFAFHIELICLEKFDFNYSPSSYGWIVENTGSLTLVRQTAKEKEKSEFEPYQERYGYHQSSPVQDTRHK